MKKFILSLCLLGAIGSATAHGYYYGYRNNWAAPAVIGAAVGYSLARPYYYAPPVYYVPPPVYIQPPMYIQQSVPAGYIQQTILDANCNCYRTVLVPQQ